MIKASFSFQPNSFTMIVKGHAYSGNPGHDLVCAGVSSIIIGGLSALKEIEQYLVTIKDEEGYVSLVSEQALSNYDAIVMYTLYRQILTIANQYPQYIQVIKKGTIKQ